MAEAPTAPPGFRPEDYDFELPAEQIAQAPAERREAARLMVVPPSGPLGHHQVSQLGDLLDRLEGPPPLVVVNESRVVPARAHLERSDGRVFELLFAAPAPGQGPGAVVAAWVRRAKRLAVGDRLRLGALELRNLGPDPTDSRARRFEVVAGDVLEALEVAGALPLPPYVERIGGPTEDDRQRYQTVYARRPGSVAAPTAGLHFTPELLDRLDPVRLTLHVGPGTFLPMDVDDVRSHRVGSERIEITAEAASRIEGARAEGRPVLAVGTTSVRALESVAARHEGRVVAWRGATDLVITPEHRFRVVRHLMTNFHLPRSSLLMLVASLAGRERTLEAYRAAVAGGYRFYSYGDATLFLSRGEANS